MYNGFVVSCVGIIFYRGAYFGLYDTSQTFITGASFGTKFAISYAVTVSAGLISYPLDTIRRRMMMTSGTADSGKYASSIDCAKQILAKEGMGSMFKGAGSNVLRGLCGSLVLVGFDYLLVCFLTCCLILVLIFFFSGLLPQVEVWQQCPQEVLCWIWVNLIVCLRVLFLIWWYFESIGAYLLIIIRLYCSLARVLCSRNINKERL